MNDGADLKILPNGVVRPRNRDTSAVDPDKLRSVRLKPTHY